MVVAPDIARRYTLTASSYNLPTPYFLMLPEPLVQKLYCRCISWSWAP